MKRLALFLLIVSIPALAQERTQASGKARQIAEYIGRLPANSPLNGSVWGFYARDTQGNILADHQSAQRMVPASNLKLVTTGTALHHFGPGHRFKTSLGYTGVLNPDGTLDGDLYIIGGGDPTLASGDSIALSADALFRQWKALLTQHGIRRIQGRIIGDGSAWEGNLEHPSWGFDDLGTYYGTGGNALCFYRNTIDYAVSAAAEGESVNFRQTYPETPWMHLANYSVTGPAGSGNSLYLYTTDLAPYAELRGSFASDRTPKKERFSNKFGPLTCAFYFRNSLLASGWEVKGGYAFVGRDGYITEVDFTPTQKAGTPHLIGYTEGPELSEIARLVNVRSDNFYAESLLRALGEDRSGVALYDSCLVAGKDILLSLGVNPEPAAIADGCGLSRMNSLSPRWMVEFLDAMQQSPAFGAFLSSLPAPGQGTLSAVKLSDRIRMKSGSMSGVLCYSGYILDDAGKPAVTFSLMSNNTVAPERTVRAALIRLISLLIPQTD